MIVRDVFRDRSSEMALADRNQPIEALLFDRSHEPFGVGIRIGRLIRRLHDADPRLAQSRAHRRAPLRVAITDQHAMLDQQPVIRGRHRAHDLLHEPLVGMRRRAHDLHATRGQVDHEHGVVRHQAAPRPDLRREEIRAGNRAPVRPQKRLPRGRPFRHRRHARRLQDPRDRRAADAMPDVLQRALDPRVAPRRILLRHPHDQPPNLGEHAAPTRPGRRVRPLPGDQLPMPAEQRVGRDDRGDLAQRLTAQPVRPRGEPPPVVIGEAQAPPTQLPAQEAVFFDQIGDRLPLAALEPAGQDQQQHLEGRGGDHERELISQPAVFARHNSSIELWDTTGCSRAEDARTDAAGECPL